MSKPNSIERAEFAEQIARRIRACKSQREAVQIAADLLFGIAPPASIYKAADAFGDALCDSHERLVNGGQQ